MWLQNQQIVGAALAAARKRGGLSQIEVARRLSKPQSFVSNYEKGQRRVDVLELVRIAKVLDQNPRRIFADILRRMPSKS